MNEIIFKHSTEHRALIEECIEDDFDAYVTNPEGGMWINI